MGVIAVRRFTLCLLSGAGCDSKHSQWCIVQPQFQRNLVVSTAYAMLLQMFSTAVHISSRRVYRL